MERRNYDGSVDLYDSNFLEEQRKKIAHLGSNEKTLAELLLNKIADDRVKSVTLHKHPAEIEVPQGSIVRLNNKPGEIIHQSNRKYIVMVDGSWRRLDK